MMIAPGNALGGMRSLLALALIAPLAAGTLSFSNASTDANAPVARVAERLLGTWDCRGPVPGSAAREVYTRSGENTIMLRNAVHTARGLSGVVHETFGYDPVKATWQLSAPMNRFFDLMQLGAQRWGAQQWVFTGTQTVQNVARPTRIVYTSLGPGAYRREHQSETGVAWKADGAFVCRRASPAKPRFVAAIGVQRSPAAVPAKQAIGARAKPKAAAIPAPRAARSTARVALGMPAERTISPLSGDRAYALVGAWSCRTFGGASATHTFARRNDATLLLHNVLRISDRNYDIDETYRFDRSNQTWSNVTQGGAYVGTARRWLGSTWVFDGSVAERGRRVPVKMTYAILSKRAFRRRFNRLQNGAWVTYAAETCKRQ